MRFFRRLECIGFRVDMFCVLIVAGGGFWEVDDNHLKDSFCGDILC